MYRIIGADGREYGPVSAALLVQWLGEGRVNAETKALAEGSAEWKRLGSLPDFSIYFRGSVPPPPAAAPIIMTPLAAVRQTNGFAIGSLALGITSWTLGLCCYGTPFNVLGIVCGFLALSQIKANPQLYNGKGLAIAGLILCIASLLLMVVLILALGAFRAWTEVGHHIHRL